MSRPSQSRSRSPLGSMNGTPLACALLPGAWLAITRREVAEACMIGRGPSGRSAQMAAGAGLGEQRLNASRVRA